MKRKLLLVVLAAALLGAAPPAWGEFYVIAVPAGVGTPIASLPKTISQPGFYYLKGNLTSTGDGITIEASDVTLDLMGFCISGAGTSNGIYIGSFTYKNVEVRNGTVRSFQYGIRNSLGSGCRFINLRAEYNTTGIYISANGGLITGCTSAFNWSHGFDITGGVNLIGNVACYNTTYGFSLSGSSDQLVDRNVSFANGANWAGLSGCTTGLNTP